ncbi:MAG: ATP-dependent metallopeptidase FtsH/Yme1/Tma family protein, partial [Cyanobacteria bacterium P01_A01_bin.83]
MSKDNNKKWRNAGLYVLLAIVVVALGTAFLEKQPQASQTWPYSRLIDEVQNNKVETVKISADRTKAQVIDLEGTPILVNLPNDPQLIDILSDNGVDIAVLPQGDEGWLFKALSSLLFPILLLVGLFFLLRRAQSGPGSQAMNFGKSKARVQMEPKTQVTFGDVAGIEQAKLELTEVVDFLKNADRFTAIGAKIPKGV